MLPDFRVRQRDYLLEISRAITQELNLNKLLARILNISIEMLAGQAGLIALWDDRQGWLVPASIGVANPFLRYLEALLGQLSSQRDPSLLDLSQINHLVQQLTRTASFGWLTGVGLPLVVRGRVIGLIFIFRNYAGVFSPNDRALLESFADQAAIAVYNAQLYTQVRREKQYLDAVLDSAADGILIIAADHRIERCNPAFVRMVGIPKEAILGRRHEDVVVFAKQQDEMTLERAEAEGWPLTSNATLYVEGDLQRPSGVPLPVGITYAPLMQEGALVSIVATVRDITRFREADELKTTFISVISHELKTPVALIKGYVSTLRREDAHWDTSIVRDSLEVIEEEADRLTELIENLLDATRLQAGALSINLADVALAPLIRRIVEKFRTQTALHTFVVDLPEDLPIIMADENRISQLLSNLLSNAIKYSPEGGEIRITGSVRSEQVVICVSDEGCGISPEDIPHVFDRFYRSEVAKRTTKGAGLGLYLARAVVEAHGGRIWVDPKTDKGTRICFSLPKDAKRKK
ncbi:MAG: ATP-binding protein [Anaerolineales bacterium]|nr:ATP-binding protein [Anaerolineales bacterium]MDW8447988.1 ATP-binding protein [Anaerolineales bacterium]